MDYLVIERFNYFNGKIKESFSIQDFLEQVLKEKLDTLVLMVLKVTKEMVVVKENGVIHQIVHR